MLYEELQDRLDRIEDDVASLRRHAKNEYGARTALVWVLIILLAGFVALTLMVMDLKSRAGRDRPPPAAGKPLGDRPDNLLGV